MIIRAIITFCVYLHLILGWLRSMWFVYESISFVSHRCFAFAAFLHRFWFFTLAFALPFPWIGWPFLYAIWICYGSTLALFEIFFTMFDHEYILFATILHQRLLFDLQFFAIFLSQWCCATIIYIIIELWRFQFKCDHMWPIETVKSLLIAADALLHT